MKRHLCLAGKRLSSFSLFSFLLMLTCSSVNAQLINEIRIDQSGSDNDEYFELVGIPNASLSGLTYLVVGDGSGGSGVIEAVVDLGVSSLNASGFLLVAEGTFTIGTADLTASLNFENSDNVTHLLVSGFTGANGDDLDTNDDGEFDVTPWTSIVDSIALVETVDEGDQVYGENRVGPNGSFVPAHFFRCGPDLEIGDFALGTDDTPGAANDCTPRINEIRIDQSGADDDEYFELSGSSTADLSGLTFIIIGDGSAGSGVIEAIVPLTSSETFNEKGIFTAVESTFSLTMNPTIFTTILNFENSDNVTALLVDGFNGSDQQDLDTDDDGVLDVTPWTAIVDSVALIESVGSGDQVYSDTTVGPNGSFVPAHAYRCGNTWEIGTFAVDDADASDTPTDFNTCDVSAGTGGEVMATIPEIQGSASDSALNGSLVVTSGIVTGDFQGNDQLRGFYIQDATGDGDENTSDGIFVFYPDGAVDVSVGDNVTVSGTVGSFNDNTQLSSISSVVINSSGNLVNPTMVMMPESTNGDLERYEGMLIEIDQVMTISQNFFLARYGQMTLSSPDDSGTPGRLFNPTNQFPANSAEAIALADENARRTLYIDDGQDISSLGDNPDPVPFLGGPPANVLRAGDTTSSLIGILEHGRINSSGDIDYRLQPTVAPLFEQGNPRKSAPRKDSGIRIASFNVLNYFNSIDTGASNCGPLANQGCRGADSSSEFTRQRDKIITAISQIDADVVGLIELENNGSGAGSALLDLVTGLNTFRGNNDYAVVAVDEGVVPGIGTDAIAVGFIYKPSTIEVIGTPAVLETGAFAEQADGGNNRVPVAASFRDQSSREEFTVAVNHFKSKGSPPNPALGNGNDDQNDGQAAWNLRRTEAANDLSTWLSTFPTGVQDSDILVIGDINAYSKEDPILAFESNGYTNLVKQFEGDNSYSFTFDGTVGSLDHALSTQSLLSKIKDVETWHINTDEPTILDYNEEFKANIADAPLGYYSTDAFRSSDHDPIIVTIQRPELETCFVVPLKNSKAVTFCL